MKRKSIIFGIVLMAQTLCCPTVVNAKEVRYGEYLIYEGKIDGNEKPSGKGMLIFQYETNEKPGKKGNALAKMTGFDSFSNLKVHYQHVDVIEGVFKGSQITGAKVMLCIKKTTKDDCMYQYEGDLEYEIVGENHYKLKMTDGILTDNKGNQYHCYADAPFILDRHMTWGSQYDNDVKGETKASGYVYQPVSSTDELKSECPVRLTTIGTFKSGRTGFTVYDKYHGEKSLDELAGEQLYQFSFTLADVKEETFFDGGIKLTNGNKIEFDNGDFIEYDNKNELKNLSKHYAEGQATLQTPRLMLLSQGNASQIAFLPEMNPQTAYNKLIKTNSIQEIGVKFYSDPFATSYLKAAKGSAQAQYQVGMAYLEGNPVDKNKQTALKWIEKSFEGGYEPARSMRNELRIEELKEKAYKSSDQYDSWIIGHIYEFGSGNGYEMTVNLDTAIVWYKKAAALDPEVQEYVTAAEFKKTHNGADYWAAKQEKENKAAYDALCKKYGKKYTDDALSGRITIGMPEALLVSAFSSKLVQETAVSKLYRIEQLNLGNLGRRSSLFDKKSVWVKNGIVSNIVNWQ